MSNTNEVSKNVSHIKSECNSIYGSHGSEVDEILDSIKDAAEQIDTDHEQICDKLESSVDNYRENVSELESKIDSLQGEFSIDFTPQSEYTFDSMAGKMILLSSSLADDELLSLFQILAANINTQVLTQQLKEVLKKYPQLCNKLALQL